MILGVAARREIEQDAALALLKFSLSGKLKAELRLANAGGAENHGERAGNQASSQQLVEPVDAGSQPLRRRRSRRVRHHSVKKRSRAVTGQRSTSRPSEIT